MLKLAFVVQARLSSSRLPCKSALTLVSGRNCISEVLYRIKDYNTGRGNTHAIILACPEEERPFFEVLTRGDGFDIFGGDADDLSKRFYDIVQSKNLDGVIRITGDNPYICFDVLDFLFENISNKKQECISFYHQKLLPNGTVVSYLGREYIRLVNEIGCVKSREHLVVSDNNEINECIVTPKIPHHLWWPTGRFCLDDVDDYKFLLSNTDIGDLTKVEQMMTQLAPRNWTGSY